jgi:hypothetical protein
MKKQLSTLKKGLFFLALAFAAMPVFSQSKLLIGSWRLIAANKILPDGSEVADYGTDPRGIAIFTADGHYVIEIFRSEHLKFASGDRAKGTPEEYKDAVLSASCRFGTYTVDETNGTSEEYNDAFLSSDFAFEAYLLDAVKGTITFHTERASYPNLDETTHTSSFILEGDKLTWRVPPRADGSTPVSVFSRMP